LDCLTSSSSLGSHALVEDQTFDAGPGDVIVTAAGTAHSYEVSGDGPARVVCVDSPVRPQPES
jgi:quercetin dioxygenase-like cupin family protein